jgi:hypothetical protein
METVFVVRPTLGQPLILHPSNLRSFEISVAGVSPVNDCPIFEPTCQKQEEVINSLENLQIMWSKGQHSFVIPLKILEWVMQPILYEDLHPRIWVFNPDLPEDLKSYWFSWGDVPGKHNRILIEFIAQKYSIDWVNTAKIEKIDDNRTIRISTEKNYLSIILDAETTTAVLIIDDGRKDGFIVKRQNAKLNIYLMDFISRFPKSALEHQHWAGFRWEGIIKIGIDMPYNWEPEGGWPAMCDIKLNERTNFHVVYITETLPNSNDLKFIHLTDTHIARRNDLIPRVICQHLEPWQQRIFRARYRNPNDNLRAIIHHVNAMSREEKPNFIVLTGDIIDYFHDGYFKGDTYHYGYGQDAPTVPSPSTSNVRKFIDIITGQEEKGEALTIPIFIIPGNHEYLPYEHLLVFNLDPELEPTGTIIFYRLLVTILNIIPVINLGFSIFQALQIIRIPPELWHLPTSARLDEELDRHRGFQLNKIEALLFDLWKKGDTEKYRVVSEEYKKDWHSESWPSNYEETLSLQQMGRFVIPGHDHFFQYLTEISYDTDFSFPIGDHQFLCLNTGQDVEIPSADEVIASKGEPAYFSKADRGKARFLGDAPWNRGFIPQHGEMLTTAQQRAGRRGLVFLFTHAPLINHRPQEIPERDEYGKLFHTNDLNQGLIENELDYDIARNSFQMIGKEGKGFTMAFAGHTHGNNEYRLVVGKSSDLKLPLTVQCMWSWYSKQIQESSEWLKMHSPLFFVGGSQKSGHPMVREVHVGNDRLLRAYLNRYIPRLGQAIVSGPMTSFLTAFVSQFGEIGGYKGILITPIDGGFLQELRGRLTEMDRELVVWDMIENFLQMFKCLGDVIALGGYWGGMLGDFYGVCEQRDMNVYTYLQNWDSSTEIFLKSRNRLPKEITGEEKFREKFRNLGEIHEEIDFCIKKISGWVKEDGMLFVPEWYKNWKIEPPRFIPFCRIQLLLLANIKVWLNRFGLKDMDYGLETCDVEYQFKSIDPFKHTSIFHEVEKRILELFEFANSDDEKPLRLWYTFESTYMAELGGYKVEDRNELNPAVHMKWALTLPRDAIIADMIVKYQLQAEYQMKKSGIEGLRRFYSSSSARLAAWAAIGESVVYDDYLKESASWDGQKILEQLTSRVNSVINKLIGKEE